jgi:phosphonate transport system substrate-binding protein
MKKAFEQGELDMIVAPPLLISRYFKREDLGDGFVGLLEGKKQERLLLITRTDKNIDRIKDLCGKRLEIIENDELADIFLDTLVLKELQKSYKNIGLSIQNQKKSNRVVLDVFFDKADIGVIYSSSYEVMVELNPDIKNKVKILSEYPIKGRNFSFFRHDYPLIEELTSVAMGFPESPRGKQILEVFKTPEIEHCKVEELEHFDKLYKDYLHLKKLYLNK